MNKFQKSMLAVSLVALSAVGCGGVATEQEIAEAELEGSSSESLIVPIGQAPFYTQTGQCTVGGIAMLCCGPGNAIVGYQPASLVAVNRTYTSYRETLKCMPFTPDPADPNVYLNAATQRTIWQDPVGVTGGHTAMHTCDWGQVMIGIHANNNQFACQKVKPIDMPKWPNRGFIEVLDLNTADPHTPPAGFLPPGKVMHTCKSTRAFSGVHLSKNQWSCATDEYPN